ncbi:MAG: replication-relaxation family protein [Patescibacteria group bacterium]
MNSTELPTITTKQKDILLLLYRFRFLTRPQIQILLKHKHHNRIIHWLNDLTEKNYVKQYYEKTVAASPAVYSLGNISRKYFKINPNERISESQLNRVWREEKYSLIFREHCIFVSQLYISFLEVIKDTQMTLELLTKSEYPDIEFLIKPHPDAYAVITEPHKHTKRYFIDVFDDMTPRMILRKRIRQYLNYYDEQYWQEEMKKPFPKVLLICPDERSRKYLQRFIRVKLDGESDVSFFFGLRADIQKRGVQEDTWETV